MTMDGLENYTNFSTIQREINKIKEQQQPSGSGCVSRPDIVAGTGCEMGANGITPVVTTTTGTIKKIPENLKLPENMNEFIENSKPSPSLSTCSGPYIPISECFSGSPVLPPSNLLNSMDPKFYDTPRNHHINIGLNLTTTEQPYSPKRNNCPMPRLDSGHSSPTDSESVFTDDEFSQTEQLFCPTSRQLRPSDSSIENDSIGWTYAQRFSKVPGGGGGNTTEAICNNGNGSDPPPRPPKRISTLVLDGLERTKDIKECSDTENASPAIGPKDNTSYVEQSYDIPRSHRLPYHLNNNNNSPKQLISTDINAQSTPNLLVSDGGYVVKQNYYSNAAPTTIDGGGSVFRYDFIEDAPVVNRSLKPKSIAIPPSSITGTTTVPVIIPSVSTVGLLNVSKDDTPPSLNSSMNSVPATPTSITTTSTLYKPNIDRKLKPTTPKFDTHSMRRNKDGVGHTLLVEDSEEDTNSLYELQSFCAERSNHIRSGSMSNSISSSIKNEDKLQYLDLVHTTNSPQKDTTVGGGGAGATTNLNHLSSVSFNTKSMPRRQHSRNGSATVDLLTTTSATSLRRNEDSGIVYKTVDFLKTEAFMRIRQDAEKNRTQTNTNMK